MIREAIAPIIDPIIPGDVILSDSHVIRAGKPVVEREIIHKNEFGMLVVRDFDGNGIL